MQLRVDHRDWLAWAYGAGGLLEEAPDFPDDGPILLITDGQCDRVRVRREHAFVLPYGASLPFAPRGPIFRLR